MRALDKILPIRKFIQRVVDVLDFAEDLLTDGVMNLTMRMLPLALNVTAKVKKVVTPLSRVFFTVDNITSTALELVDTALPIVGTVRTTAENLKGVSRLIVELIETGDLSLIGDIVGDIATIVDDALNAGGDGGEGGKKVDVKGMAAALQDALPMLINLITSGQDLLQALGADLLAKVGYKCVHKLGCTSADVCAVLPSPGCCRPRGLHSRPRYEDHQPHDLKVLVRPRN